jgi:elongation factor G
MSQQKALDHALACLTREDPSLHVSINTETGQTILSGMGELHLEVIHHRICNEYKVDAELGEVFIAYRETIIGFAEETYVLDKQLGDTKHVVKVSLSVKQSENDQSKKDRKFMHSIRPHAGSTLNENLIRMQHRKAVKNGIISAFSRGKPCISYNIISDSYYNIP